MRSLLKLRWKIVLDRLALALSLVSSVLPIRSFSIQESNVTQRQRNARALEFDAVEWRKISVLKINSAGAVVTKQQRDNYHICSNDGNGIENVT